MYFKLPVHDSFVEPVGVSSLVSGGTFKRKRGFSNFDHENDAGLPQ